MAIFAELFLFFGVAALIVRAIRNEFKVKELEAENKTLLEKNNELLELVTSDEVDRLGKPPAGKSLLLG